MGEIAEMMLEGILCECCGEYLDDKEPSGYPRRCGACARQLTAIENPKIKCPKCGKRVAPSGLEAHTKAKHPTA